jgi:hypothetical protein
LYRAPPVTPSAGRTSQRVGYTASSSDGEKLKGGTNMGGFMPEGGDYYSVMRLSLGQIASAVILLRLWRTRSDVCFIATVPKFVPLPATNCSNDRGDESANEHREEDEEGRFRRCFATLISELLGFLFGCLHLGNDVVDALFGILL